MSFFLSTFRCIIVFGVRERTTKSIFIFVFLAVGEDIEFSAEPATCNIFHGPAERLSSLAGRPPSHGQRSEAGMPCFEAPVENGTMARENCSALLWETMVPIVVVVFIGRTVEGRRLLHRSGSYTCVLQLTSSHSGH